MVRNIFTHMHISSLSFPFPAETTISPMANIKESPSFNSLGDHSDSPATSLLKVPQSVLSSQPSFEDLSQACSVSAMTTEEEYMWRMR